MNDVDFLSLRISRGSAVSLVEPKVLSVLRVLLDRAGEVVSRDELIDAVWGNRYGGEERLSRAISLLRKALGDVRGQYQHIETVPKVGYRLMADVQPIKVSNETQSPSPAQPHYRRPTMVASLVLVIAALAFWSMAPSDSSVVGQKVATPTPAEISPGVQENSIAVLPFADLSPAGNQQYFSDGLAEEILAALAAIKGLSVAGRTSSFAYRDGSDAISAIGKALRVNFLLEGSVRKQDDRARVTAQLIRVADGYHVWSKTFDGDLNDIFEFQESVARSIAAELSPSAASATPDRLARLLTDDQQAYELYLQGREMSRRFGRQEKLAAIDLLSDAVQRDPDFADAWAWLARSHLLLPVTQPEAGFEIHINAARIAVKRALESDQNLPMGHYVSALLHDYDLDFDASFEAIERAHAAAPNQPYFAIRRGFYHLALGYLSRGASMIEAGVRMDPTDALGLLNLGQAKIHLGEVDAGMALLERSESLGFAPAKLLRCVYLGTLGRPQDAYQCWQKMPDVIKTRYPAELSQPDTWKDLGRIYAFNDQDAIRRVRAIVLKLVDDAATPMSTYLYGVLQALGEPKLYMQHFIDRPFLLNAGAARLLWFNPAGSLSVPSQSQFPEFAERIGFTRVWQRHGWPDSCHPSSSENPENLYCK